MAKFSFTPNLEAWRRIMASATTEAKVRRAAEEVAARAEAMYREPHSDAVEVEVERASDTSGGRAGITRPVYRVVAKHPAALTFEALDGTLGAAAASVAGDVKERKGRRR